MFGYCIWILLNKFNIYNQIILDYNNKSNLKIHQAHITEQYNIINNPIKFYRNYKLDNIKEFKPILPVYQCSKNDFHALQLDLSPKNDKNYHISLSYRTDRPYSQKEIDDINSYSFPEIIFSECELKLFDCNSLDSDEWSDVKE